MSPTATAKTSPTAPKGAKAATALPGGVAGRLLRVNMTTGKCWPEAWKPEDMREYLGGVGLGARILYDEVGPKANWDHPDNRLVLATGPLAGLPVRRTGGLTVVTRGALPQGERSPTAHAVL